MARRFEDSTLEPPIKYRLIFTWVMTSGIPLIGIVLVLLGQRGIALELVDDFLGLFSLSLEIEAADEGLVGSPQRTLHPGRRDASGEEGR